jgi:hypothetical protein
VYHFVRHENGRYHILQDEQSVYKRTFVRIFKFIKTFLRQEGFNVLDDFNEFWFRHHSYLGCRSSLLSNISLPPPLTGTGDNGASVEALTPYKNIQVFFLNRN